MMGLAGLLGTVELKSRWSVCLWLFVPPEFSRVSTPEAQPRKGKRTAAGFGPADQVAKKRATRPELKHPPRAANGTCVMPNPPAAVAGFP